MVAPNGGGHPQEATYHPDFQSWQNSGHSAKQRVVQVPLPKDHMGWPLMTHLPWLRWTGAYRPALYCGHHISLPNSRATLSKRIETDFSACSMERQASFYLIY